MLNLNKKYKIRVYVAGAYSADNILDIFNNMRKGMRLGLEVLLAGYAPFVPWFDYHFQLMLRETETIPLSTYYEYSLAWLRVSNAVLVVPNSENSIGTQNEIKEAVHLGIPIFYSLDELNKSIRS